MKNTIYKLGDTVYFYSCYQGLLKGKITSISDDPLYPVHVEFEFGNHMCFTEDGKLGTTDMYPTLSFVPYDHINGGFSQARLFTKGDIIEAIGKHTNKKIVFYCDKQDEDFVYGNTGDFDSEDLSLSIDLFTFRKVE